MPLLINQKRISVYQALFLCAGYQVQATFRTAGGLKLGGA